LELGQVAGAIALIQYFVLGLILDSLSLILLVKRCLASALIDLCLSGTSLHFNQSVLNLVLLRALVSGRLAPNFKSRLLLLDGCLVACLLDLWFFWSLRLHLFLFGKFYLKFFVLIFELETFSLI